MGKPLQGVERVTTLLHCAVVGKIHWFAAETRTLPLQVTPELKVVLKVLAGATIVFITGEGKPDWSSTCSLYCVAPEILFHFQVTEA